MRKILILRGGALGDFIVTLPALALLRARWPEARIELVGNATAAALAKARGLLDEVHSQHEARWSALFGDEPLPASLAEFDLVVSYWPDPDGSVRRRFPLRDGQIFLSGEAIPARAPAAAHYCEPLRELGLTMTQSWVPLAARDPRATRIAVHPGSGSPRKNWPDERWREVIATLPEPVFVVRGEAESARNFPLEQLVTELARCRLFLGHDSGVSHLAAACGVPCILLFGPTDPAIWAPPAPDVRIIRRDSEMSSISVADVQRELASALPGRK